MEPVRTDIDTLIARMRVLAAQAGTQPAAPETAQGAAGAGSFQSLLARSIDEVNGMQQRAEGLATAFERGAPDVSLAQVMVASQKAGVAFQAMTEVRNRLVRAYENVMNMPV